MLATLACAAACAGATLPVATEIDATRAAERFPGTTAADLAHGRKLYQGRCGACHRPVQPAKVPSAEWPGHVHEMQQRAHLSDEEAALVERYLVTMSARN
ncbi:MAG TPA: hypothetical protein VKE22_25815 [Haliangiales bacterium]|nr:hypothetical protein [Haliangiales bacterium]